MEGGLFHIRNSAGLGLKFDSSILYMNADPTLLSIKTRFYIMFMNLYDGI